jgi:hypothetical protein
MEKNQRIQVANTMRGLRDTNIGSPRGMALIANS